MLELTWRDDFGEIEESPRDRRDGDPVANRAVVRIESARAVNSYAGTAVTSPPERCHVDGGREGGHQPPQRGGASVAEDSSRAACEHSSERTPVTTHGRMPDRVHATMDPVQASDPDPMTDGLDIQAEVK
jgi:hypothetical protein